MIRSDIAGTKVMMMSQMNSKVFSDLNFCEFIFSNPLQKTENFKFKELCDNCEAQGRIKKT
ncbi:unnamed protein product [Gulo gulo]|uniref:Uncharacterized protein n=1 Tax=Gulo gulo TaxID=48420 RepID=A0A9X9Q5I5_GULGU|nr:unnamed protein product [Gulo gulo]